MLESPILEKELHKIFENYPDILCEVFVEAGFIPSSKRANFEIFYSAYRNRLRLKSGIPDMILGVLGEKEHYLVEIKTLSQIVIEQLMRYHSEATLLLSRGKYPHNIKEFIPMIIRPQISASDKRLLAKKQIRFVELDNLQLNNAENIIRESSRRIYEHGRVRKEIKTLGVHRATYILPLLDFLYQRYTHGEVVVSRAALLGERSRILVSHPKKPPSVRPRFARIGELIRVAKLLQLVDIHRKGNRIVGVSLTPTGLKAAKNGIDRIREIMFTQNQLRYLLPILVDDPFRNFLIYGIFGMVETIIELGVDTEYEHIKEVFKHKVGLCRKSSATIDSTVHFYLNYCEDLGLIIRLEHDISPTQLGRIAYRVMRTNEVEAVAKREIVAYF